MGNLFCLVFFWQIGHLRTNSHIWVANKAWLYYSDLHVWNILDNGHLVPKPTVPRFHAMLCKEFSDLSVFRVVKPPAMPTSSPHKHNMYHSLSFSMLSCSSKHLYLHFMVNLLAKASGTVNPSHFHYSGRCHRPLFMTEILKKKYDASNLVQVTVQQEWVILSHLALLPLYHPWLQTSSLVVPSAVGCYSSGCRAEGTKPGAHYCSGWQLIFIRVRDCTSTPFLNYHHIWGSTERQNIHRFKHS